MCVCCCPILALTLSSHLLRSSGFQTALPFPLVSPINPRRGLICHHRHNNYHFHILEHRADTAAYVPGVVTGCCMHFKNCVVGRIKAGAHCTQRKLSWGAKLPRGRKKKTYCIAPAPSVNSTTTIYLYGDDDALCYEQPRPATSSFLATGLPKHVRP